ncbi:hypothetical protein PIB30_042488 [Stylosanthes scabra]|uniref:Uncharacterized protein n=1 Tax=Stylosanthes scabra TaxID=79078 RepID=A0ABU6YDV5_9FABA|nr:hypothetical protein [Stylosanthes scabra]
MNPSPSNYDETLCTYQQVSQELREAHKRTEACLNDLTELLHKFATQMVVNSQPHSSSNPLPSQPLPNPKGGINMVQITSDKGAIAEAEDDKEEEDEKDDDWLYDLLAKLVGVDSDSDDEYEEDKEEEVIEEDEEEEMIEITEEATEEEVNSQDKEGEFFIVTVYGVNEEKPEDLPEKCANPGPCFVTCKIGKSEDIIVRVGQLSIPTDFHVIRAPKNNNGSNPQVLLRRPFLKTACSKLNFYDETFSLEVGNVIEIFQPTRPPISQEESVHQGKKEESVGEFKQKETVHQAVIPKQKKGQKTPTPVRRGKQKKEDTKAVKKKKPEKGKEERKAELNCTTFKDLLGKLKKINGAIIKDNSIGVHLVEDNSNWK